MGTFSVTIGVGHPNGEGDLSAVSAIVDTGATDTVVPASLLAYWGIAPIAQWPFDLADGSQVIWDAGQARIAYAGQEWICPVIFGEEDQYLLGATTLEAFKLMVDPVNQQLVPVIHRARPI